MIVQGDQKRCQELVVPWRSIRPTVESMLRWSGRLGRLVGRENELEILDRWAFEDHPLSIKVLSGPAGSGKTRLGVELAQSLMGKGWAAGFYDPDEPATFKVGNGALLLVDYPEERSESVDRLLRALSRMQEPDFPVRVLLLSRREDSFWMPRFDSTHVSDIVELGLGLGGLEQGSLTGLFMDCWRRVRELYQMDVDPPPNVQDFAEWLAGDPIRHRPIFVIAHSIDSALGLVDDNGRTDRVVQTLARHELARWRNQSIENGLVSDAVGHLRSIATISGGLSQSQVQTLADQAPLPPSLPPANEIIGILDDAGVLVEGRIEPIEPDLLGAAVLTEQFSRIGDLGGRWMLRALLIDRSQSGLSAAIQRLGRISHDILYELHASWPSSALAELIGADLALCEELRPHFGSVVPLGLGPIPIAVNRCLVNVVQDLETKATLQHNLAIHLSAEGDIEGALEVAQLALEARTQMAGKAAGGQRSEGLARSYLNYGQRLAEAGRYVEALDATRRGVEICELLNDGGRKGEASLAGALNNLGNRLADTHDVDKAIEVSRRAVDLFRRLAEQSPSQYQPELARSLNNLANRLADVGQNTEALKSARRARVIRRRMAKESYGLYLPDLAASHSDCANRFAAVGRDREALRAAQSGARMFERLANANPLAHEPDFGICLNGLANRHLIAGNHDDAVATSRRAVEIYERLARSNPAAHGRNLGIFLSNLAKCRVAAGDFHLAVRDIERAVQVFEEMAREDAKYHADLARCRSIYADVLSRSGNDGTEESLDPSAERIRSLD